MRPGAKSLTSLGAALMLAGAAPVTLAQEFGAVTPYRPSVSSPAQLPLPGQLEFEAGVLSAHGGDDGRRDSLPVLFKLAFSEQWGVLVGGDAFVSVRDGDAGYAKGIGDTTLTLKRALVLDSATALGLELSAKLPSASTAIGSGRADYELNTIASKDLGQVHMDLNANLTRLGAWDAGTGRNQLGLSASFAAEVAEHWGANAELSGTHRRHAGNTAQLLLAATYSPSKLMTFDVGVTRGLADASPDWSFFTGVVVPLARLW